MSVYYIIHMLESSNYSQQPPETQKLNSYAAFCAIIYALAYIVFLIFDSLYIDQGEKCLFAIIMDVEISFNFGIWLLIKIIIPSALIGILLIANKLGMSDENCGICLFITLVFNCSWLCVGGVMFWGYLAPNKICSKNFQTYMTFDLLVNGVCHVVILIYGMVHFYKKIVYSSSGNLNESQKIANQYNSKLSSGKY